MIFSEETIVLSYNKAIEEGDPQELIRSIAKTAGVDPEAVIEVLTRKGVYEMPRGRRKAAVINEDFEQAVSKTTENVQKESESDKNHTKILPLPDSIKSLITQRLDHLEKQIQEHEEAIRKLQSEYKGISNYMKGITEE